MPERIKCKPYNYEWNKGKPHPTSDVVWFCNGDMQSQGQRNGDMQSQGRRNDEVVKSCDDKNEVMRPYTYTVQKTVYQWEL